MTTPVITDFPLPFPAKGQSDPDLDNNVDAYLSWLSGTNVPELQIALPWVQARLEEVAATALSGTLPDISAQALNYFRVNAGASAVEFRTPAQVRADISAAPLASPALTGIPTAPTAAAATNTTQIATTAFALNALPASTGLATPSRSTATVYQNNTNRPIFVQMNGVLSVAATLFGNVGPTASPAIQVAGSSAGSGTRTTVGFWVPPSFYYSCTLSGGSLSSITWTETS